MGTVRKAWKSHAFVHTLLPRFATAKKAARRGKTRLFNRFHTPYCYYC